MPSYTLIDESGAKTNKICTHKELIKFLEENPSFKQGLSTPKLVSSTGDIISKTPDIFKDRMKNMREIYGEKNTNIKL